MALNSVFYDGPVTETDRAKNRAGAPDYGVYGDDDFKVSVHPSIPYALVVKAGKAHGHGVTDIAATDQTVQCGTLSGAGAVRYDLIVVRRNWQPLLGGPSTLVSIKGGTTAIIPAGRLTNPGVEDDQPLALVEWRGGVNTPNRIIDLRCWAGNGGLTANDDLVRSYMKVPGTQLEINGVGWLCTVGSNGVAAWEKQYTVGRFPLFGIGGSLAGSTPPAGTEGLVQAGTVVATTDAAGYSRITWPKKFPNGLISLQLTSGDDWSNGYCALFNVAGRPEVFKTAGGGNQEEVVYVMQGSDNSGNNWRKVPFKQHRVNYTAIGW